MVPSLLDTDFYKLTMMQVVLHQYARAWVRYAFKWRNWDQMHLKGSLENFKRKLDEEIDKLCGLRFQEDELAYLVSIRFPSIFLNPILLNTSDCFNSTENILKYPSRRIG
jgi:nicotinate phosphoribosyltransferase